MERTITKWNLLCSKIQYDTDERDWSYASAGNKVVVPKWHLFHRWDTVSSPNAARCWRGNYHFALLHFPRVVDSWHRTLVASFRTVSLHPQWAQKIVGTTEIRIKLPDVWRIKRDSLQTRRLFEYASDQNEVTLMEKKRFSSYKSGCMRSILIPCISTQ